MYEVYGNYFLHNHREALLQAAGRVTVHDNVFVDGPSDSTGALRGTKAPLKIAYAQQTTLFTLLGKASTLAREP